MCEGPIHCRHHRQLRSHSLVALERPSLSCPRQTQESLCNSQQLDNRTLMEWSKSCLSTAGQEGHVAAVLKRHLALIHHRDLLCWWTNLQSCLSAGRSLLTLLVALQLVLVLLVALAALNRCS